MTEEEAQPERRVRLWSLNDQGQWDEKGTGHLQQSTADDGDGEFIILTVMCEQSGELLLEHKIETRIDYQMQGDTIITWYEESTGIDLGLSFLEKTHCDEVWEQIRGELPFPELSNLKEISQRINRITPMTPQKKDMAASCLMKDDYLEKLFSLFEAVEDLEEVEDAKVIFDIFKGIFLLNKKELFDLILSDTNIMKVIATLEYDPKIQATEFQTHRKFLTESKFKEVIPFNNEELLSMVHQNYRLAYIKDVILLQYLDDATMSTLNSMILFNNIEIMGTISDEKDENDILMNFFAELHKLASFDPSNTDSYIARSKSKAKKEADALADEQKLQTRKDLFLFLQELCTLAKPPIPASVRNVFYKKLDKYGVFRAIEDALVASPPERKNVGWLWLSVAEILSNILAYDTSLVRAHMLTRLSVPTSLLGSLVSNVVSTHVGCGLSDQIAQILRTLLDPDTMLNGDKEVFLDHFYDKHAIKILNALSVPNSAHDRVFTNDSVQYQACELLSYFVQQHGFRSKQLLLKNNALSKIGALLKERKKPNVVCSAVRFIRSCVGNKDDEILRELIQEKVLDTMMDVFVANGARYNLLNSSVIELLHFVKQENVKVLVHYFVMNHASKFKNVRYVQTFEELKQKWEQNQEYMKSGGKSGGGSENGSSAVSDASEYAYFNEESDDDNESGDGKTQMDRDDEEKFLKTTEEYRKNQKRKLEDDIDLIEVLKKNKTTNGDPEKRTKIKMNLKKSVV